MIELSNSKTTFLGKTLEGRNKFSIDSYIGAVQMRDTPASQWVDIDPTLDSNGLPKAVPYEVTPYLDGLPGFHIKSKVDNGEWDVRIKEARDDKAVKVDYDTKVKSEIKDGKIVWKDLLPDVDVELVFSNTCVTLQRIIKSDKAATEYDIDIVEIVHGAGMGLLPLPPAVDADGQCIKMEETTKAGGRTETLKKEVIVREGQIAKAIKYPIMDASPIDVQVGNDEDSGGSYSTSDATGLASFANTLVGLGSYYGYGTQYYYANCDRFSSVIIPVGVTSFDIVYLTYTAYSTSTGTTVNSRIAAVDSANPAAFTGLNLSTLTKTSTLVDWNNIGAWTKDSPYNSLSIISIIAELYASYDYSAGAPIAFLNYNNGSSHGPPDGDWRRNRYTHKGSASQCAKLHIEYTVGGGALELSITDGIKVGDSRSESMVASLSRTDGLKSGDSTNELAMLTRADGLKVGDARSLLGYMSPSISDGLKIGDIRNLLAILTLTRIDNFILADSRLAEMLASPSRTDGIALGDVRTLIALLTRVDGLKLGDVPLSEMLASLSMVDSVKLSDTPLAEMIANLTRTDGLKVSDARLLSLLASLSIADSVKLSDTPLSSMLTSLSRTDSITVGDIRNLVAMVERTDSLVIEKIIGGTGTKLNRGFN